ncbi:MAG TPA: FlgD immunoglobulin-like domain containing protein [Candidatus Eisenbacteria bacterium]|nr:FlgD immunoglobulin-like domain containing protein [Candidatus Eisenbacteria bacterium]
MRPRPRSEQALPTAVRILWALLFLSVAPPHARDAEASVESFGLRQTPLAYEPEYGELFLTTPGSPGGALVVATREGLEVRAASDPGGDPLGLYRTAGVVEGIAGAGARAYLFQGDRGVSLIDLSTPATPRLATSFGTPHAVRFGAILGDGSVVAASDSFVQILRLEPTGDLTLLETLSYADGRQIRRVRASGDSFLVVAARPGVLPRLYLTVYRLPAGAGAATRLAEWLYNGRGATDACWRPPIAFVSDGNNGITSFQTATGAVIQTSLYRGGLFARALDEGAGDLFAIGEAGTLQRFTRYGALGESLLAHTGEGLEFEPHSVAVDGVRAIVTTRDVLSATEPDEVGRSQIEFPTSSQGSPPPVAAVRRSGRARRVVMNGGLAYVADYTGGLRIFRAGGADTSLVGVLPPLGSARPVDLALDAAQSRLYLASGPAGVEVVDIADPASPQRLGSLVLPGLASAVAVIDGSTVAVARRGGFASGVTFVDVSVPTAPSPRGAVNTPLVQEPAALAVRDTILFVADEQLGLLSVRFGNPDAPATLGLPTGNGARDLDLQGNLLLVASRSRGLQVVDVFDPTLPLLRSELALPTMFGVTRQGASAIGCLGAAGVALIDLAVPTSARLRSIVPAAGVPRDAAWSGDTLLVAGGTSIERFLLAPANPVSGALSVSMDQASALPRVLLGWSQTPSAGQAGWNLYRETGSTTAGSAKPIGTRVNSLLVPAGATGAVDQAPRPGSENRYRLEAVYEDGRVLTVAEGSIFVSSNTRLGRAYPNPFRSSDGSVGLPFRALGGGGVVTLRVVDVRGRLVREISAPAPASAGFGEVRWDGRRADGEPAPSGVYYLYIRGAGIDEARSVVRIR